MIETGSLLRAYADLIRRFSGAGSVSLFLAPLREGDPPTLIHQGDMPAVTELEDAEVARALDASFLARGDDESDDRSPLRLDSRSNDGVLFRIPVLSPHTIVDEEGSTPDRRSSGETTPTLAVWIGLRFPAGSPGLPRTTEALQIPFEARESPGEGWWNRILNLAAALASHAHAISRVLEDPLTGLPGRSGLLTELGLALDRSRRSQRPLALLMINPDDYAQVNERFGRTSGDDVLREVAQRLRRRVRGSDRAARYGGATFAVVLLDTDAAAAASAGESIRRELTEKPFLGGALRLDFSVGLASLDPTIAADCSNPSEWIRKADQALYQAKRQGGQRTLQWTMDHADDDQGTLDRLQGIFTGDVNSDYRNMALLWEVVQLIASASDPVELTDRVVARLQTWLRARVIAIVENTEQEGTLRVLAARVDGDRPAKEWTLPAQAADRVVRGLESGEPILIRRDPEDPASRESCSLRLAAGDRCVGCLYLESDESTGNDAFDPRFLTALASQIAIALDRARLRQAERRHEVQEREILQSEVHELRRVLQSTRLSYRSEAMGAVLTTVRRVAPTGATILISGESGTGKEVLARTIHQLGDRRDRPLIVVDCGAISTSLIDSELFGHEKGAFTGAHARKTGRLAEADGATVFLDEIGELPIDVQSKLLRFVQERQVTPVGKSRPIEVDARILAATNLDLAERVRAGKFREDLYHRLNVVHLRLPPLRERREDISHLAGLFVQQYASLYRKDGMRLSPAAERALREHPWPGNIRELQNRIMRAVLFADGGEIRPEDFEGLENGASPLTPGVPESSRDEIADSDEGLRRLLRREVERALAVSDGARPLGKWLETDLVLAADRVTDGVSRRAATILGMADTTYRRRLAKAERERRGGLEVRTDSWQAVRRSLESLVQRNAGAGRCIDDEVAHWMLETIGELCAGDPRTGAALLGVTEQTYLRRLTSLRVEPSPALH